MAKTNSGLVKYAKAHVGDPYWYGCYGQTATAALYTSKKAQYPSYYTATDFEDQYGYQVFDCTGLIKGYLWSDSTTGTPTYKASEDWNAKTVYSKATTKGKISTFPKTAGLLVFKGSSASAINHVGVYGGDGYVYEAKGHAYGVRKTSYTASDWNFWAQDSRLTDDTTSTSTSTSSTSTSTSSSSTKKVTATSKAASYDESIAGTYKVTTSTANLNVRNGAGTTYKVLTSIAKGTKVKNYGYYTTKSGVKWLYIQFTQDGTTYTGFASGKYLTKC